MSAVENRPRAHPVIVMGMHRSGTSLVARILAQAGVHMGGDRNVHDESDFFRELNKEIFRSGHADWDWPLALRPALADTALCDALEKHLGERCGSKEARAYTDTRFGRVDLATWDRPWGWKDPRNTCTLPLWRRVFPSARILNVYRDGIDVAASLVTRERKRAGRLANPIRSSRCLDPEGAFEVWSEYMEMTLDATADLHPQDVRDVRFERLVAKPEEGVRELLGFLGIALDDERVEEIASEVDASRVFASRREPEWQALRSRKASHPLMRRLDYGDGT